MKLMLINCWIITGITYFRTTLTNQLTYIFNMLNYIKPIIKTVNLMQPEEQKTAALVIANVIFITVLVSITVTLFVFKFI